MRTTLVILLIPLGSLLAACEEPDGWASRGVMGEATCQQGQHVIAYGPSGIPACAAN
jgi:hypothetical protein